MGNNNIMYGIIGLLIVGIIGLAIDRSNQITSLTEQATALETSAQEASDNLSATIEAQVSEAEANVELLDTMSTQMAVSSTQFEAEITSLAEQSSALTSSNIDLMEENDDLITQVADLSTQRDELTEQSDGLATQAADLQTSLDDASANADGLQTQIAEIEANNADMVATLEAENAMLEALVPTATATPDLSQPDTADVDFVFELEVENQGVVDISPDDSSIAVLGADNTVHILSAEDGASQLELGDFDGELSDIMYSNSGDSFAAIVDAERVVVFNSATGASSHEQDASNPTGYDFAPDDNALIVGTARDIEIAVIDSGRSQSRQGGITSLDWSADGTQIATANGRSVTVFDVTDYSISGTTDLDAGGASVVLVALSPDGALIAGATINGELAVLSVESANVAWETDLEADEINDIAWSSDSGHFAVVADGDIRIYSATGSFVAQATIDGVTSVDWSSDGSFLAFAGADGVYVVDSATLMN